MPRKPRQEAAGAIHHVIARGNGGGRIVLDDDDRPALVMDLARVSEKCCWRIHAYCLMDTHVHAVIETLEPTLGAGMQRLLGSYAYGFNHRHGRYGHLFAGPFSASLVKTDAHVIELCAYVVLNPVRDGIVRAPEDWRWSSHRATAGLVKLPSFVETTLVPGMLHPDRKRARELYRELVFEIAERPRPGSG